MGRVPIDTGINDNCDDNHEKASHRFHTFRSNKWMRPYEYNNNNGNVDL